MHYLLRTTAKVLLPAFMVCIILTGCGSRTAATANTATLPPQIDQVINNYYKAISGKGEKDFELLRAITLPATQFNAMGINEQGQNQYYPQMREEYIEHLTPYIKEQGYYQTERYRNSEHFNKMAQVWSVYESRNSPGGEIIDRGVYSFQMVQLNGEWKIVNVLWNSETAVNKVTEHYFKD